jgi:uncharacterized protein (DUF305 family)
MKPLQFSVTRILCVVAVIVFSVAVPLYGQQPDPTPVIVRPGAPGQETKVLPANTRPALLGLNQKDVEFMQGMIMHHAQAVEMTALIDSRSENKELRRLGARISHSQSDEMHLMERWLAARGQPAAMKSATTAPSMPGMTMSMPMPMMMPGMLSPKQMDALRSAKGREFDRLFLIGMIQHHNGALVMVKDLFDAGGGQDADLFNFATDVDSGQRAEIRIMQAMLEKNP